MLNARAAECEWFGSGRCTAPTAGCTCTRVTGRLSSVHTTSPTRASGKGGNVVERAYRNPGRGRCVLALPCPGAALARGAPRRRRRAARLSSAPVSTLSNLKQVLLAALEEVERHEGDIEGELRAVVVAYSVENDEGLFRIGWANSDSPYYALVGLLGEVAEGIASSAGEWVKEDTDEED